MAATLEVGGQWPTNEDVRLPQQLNDFVPELVHSLRNIDIFELLFCERAHHLVPSHKSNRKDSKD